MPLLASLPMYDHEAIETDTDQWWQVISNELRNRGVAAPEKLTRSNDSRLIWRDPNLLLTQCCGYDLMVNGYDNLEPILTPIYGFEDCEGGNYCSYIVVARDGKIRSAAALKGKLLAINGYRSHSGYNALREYIALNLGVGAHEQSLVVSGSHYNSMKMTAEGEAAAAAVDCVTYGIVASYAPELVSKLLVLGKSPFHSVLPYAVPKTMDDKLKTSLLSALKAALEKPEYHGIRDRLGIRSFILKNTSDYLSIKVAEQELRDVMPDFLQEPGR